MAKRQSKLSLEEVGGLLVDIVRPVASTSVRIYGGTIVVKDVVTNLASTTFNIQSVAAGLAFPNRFYKVLVFYNQATSAYSARFSTSDFVSAIAAEADTTITVGIREIPLAFVIVESLTATTITAISDAQRIIDIRGVNNAVRNIEQLRTYVATPLNKLPVADASGNFNLTRDLDLNSLDIDTTLVVGTTSTLNGVVRVNDATNATDATGDTGSFGTDGGASIQQDLYVGGDANVSGDLVVTLTSELTGNVRVNNANDATNYTGNTGSLGTEGGVSIAKNLFVGESVQEQSQITLGDGVTTFGHFSSTDFAGSIAAAVALLPSGGKIFVKRGTYSYAPFTIIATDDIQIIGEGASTNVEIDGFSLPTPALEISAERVSISNIRFTSITSGNAPAPILKFTVGGSKHCTLTNCWFIGQGTFIDTDITYDIADGHVISNCISSTSTTNLP